MIYYKRAHRAGILFIHNIWNSVEGEFLTFPQVQNIYGHNVIMYMQYYGIISSIPRNWVQDLRNTRFILEDFQFAYESFEGKMSSIMYNKMVSKKTALLKLSDKWNNKLGISMPYDLFLENFQNLYELTPSTKIRNFQYRFLHRVIFCSKLLYSWKLVESPLCTFCSQEYETIEHLFFHCAVTKRFLEMFQAWFEALTDTEILLNMEVVFYCNHEDDFLNILLIILKQYIYSCRCMEKELNVYNYKDYIMQIIRIERLEAFQTGKFKKFVKKWGKMFLSITT